VNQISSALSTDQGRRRPHNEDFIAFFEPNDLSEIQTSGNLYIVADGVGGAESGERASRFATQKVLYEYYQNPEANPGDRLRNAMRQAGNEIYQYATESVGLTRMATTMVAAVIRDQMLTVANVGDSRAYLIRNGHIEQITRDHSIVGEMVRNGLMTEEEASRSKVKNKITRSLGGEFDVRVDVFKAIPLQPGDLVLLCSDGLTRYANSKDLIKISSQNTPQEAVKQMIDFANAAGGADNISVILVEIGQPLDAEEPTLPLPRGQIPEPIDWDTMQTQPSLKPIRVRRKRSIQSEYLLMALVVLALIVMMGMVLLTYKAINWQSSTTQNETPASTQEPTIPTGSSLQDVPVSETPAVENDLQSSIENSPATVSIQETSVLSPTSVLNIPASPALEIMGCVVKVKQGDTLGTILSQFDLQVDTDKQYYDFLTCSVDPPSCQDKQELQNPNVIEIDHWILIEEINQEACNDNPEGLWVIQME